ncbi:hypothetical protein HanRHA438_Chr15g0726191 [Helianthus annuus]|uniref:Uncharacterized protein n=1 Tax=Helianthus annuus TaxID=4232 RepID=A0A9K3H4Q6_HELAN|nr:hypothetical protein HanXRQr2_Chr15g0713931 [Helianthus annuus]KAJ0452725.1 hypothetical protein HanHA300_Chr15g0582211 [Helianthus annuus]KAJ0474635.1 hypothetical protein HanHA89_Chr15g0631961 [Helianthus annuus]KAJ0650192.1 hypothetical protein HanLR1_Chr15g0592881 [Helianthus annuus]KAJ0653966.1 hypothetical protein HanOQP8_Chr15g0589541 [Helianthus annuus]
MESFSSLLSLSKLGNKALISYYRFSRPYISFSIYSLSQNFRKKYKFSSICILHQHL